MGIRLSCLLMVIFWLLLGCETKSRYEHYQRLIGKWEIVSIESLAEKVALEDILESRQLVFTSRGQFWQGELRGGVKGQWKIIGDRIQLLQPEIRDLNKRIVSRETQQLWEVTLSDEWMIWRGTAQNGTQHLKVTFRKKRKNDKPI